MKQLMNYQSPKIREHIEEGEFGLEKESLRIDKHGFLAHTKHPFPGNASIERDFSESQIELITPVCFSTQDVYSEIMKLHMDAQRQLLELDSGREYLWPFSNPPYIQSEKNIPVAEFQGEQEQKQKYREYLAEKYGKKKMLFSGIHYNFSFPYEMLKAAFDESDHTSFFDYKNDVYLHLAKELLRQAWLPILLLSASPICDSSYLKDGAYGKSHMQNKNSWRCSKEGYWNDFTPILNYNGLNSYIESIQQLIESGKLQSASELYYPVRLKPKGENSLENLFQSGVNHIEFRLVDLNPLSACGIFWEDIEFLHLFILYLSSLPNTSFGVKEQVEAVKKIKSAALYQESAELLKQGMDYLEKIDAFYRSITGKERNEVVEYQKEKLRKPDKRYVNRILKKYKEHYVDKGIETAKQYAKIAVDGGVYV